MTSINARPVALITGGSRGIGLGIALELAQSGYDIAISGRRDKDSVQDACSSIESRGASCLYIQSDVADLTAHASLLEAIFDRFGRIDSLVNNAGVAPTERMDILNASPESFDRLISINLKGPYFLTQCAAQRMVEQKEKNPSLTPSIVFVTSISATMVSTNRGDYCISKAGLAMASALWSARLGELGIPVYEVRPGIIKTDMTQTATEKYDRLFEQGIAVERRWGKPEDVGKAVAALVRGDLPYATGQHIMIDGGLTLPRL